jgi:hypothetical protein
VSEKEIRKIIRSVCSDLDERARRAAQTTARCVVLPTVVGLSLTMAGCDEKELDRADATAASDSAVSARDGAPSGRDSATNPGAGGRVTGPVALYAAPLGGAGGKTVVKDAGAKQDAAVKDAGPQVRYMAIIPDAGTKTDAGIKRDAGMVALYSVPFIDAGAQAEYAAPIPDSGPMLRYMAPDPKQ